MRKVGESVNIKKNKWTQFYEDNFIYLNLSKILYVYLFLNKKKEWKYE